ncbi:uncharacterized protein LOC107361491 [Tetranychus urticae]|uniref:Uncharacterized protein n=1 Tax=Tetranychus urticae TaxID=32264 RepID=T1JQ21_TETUR|nr:uncharacterized protein LOC107361491 [Tetranychus urticae]
MKAIEADQPNGHIQKDAQTPPPPLHPPQPLSSEELSSPSTPSAQLSELSSQLSSQIEPDQPNDLKKEKSTEEPATSAEPNKLDKLFYCLRKVGSAIQELVEEGSKDSYTSTFESYRSKEVPPNILPKVTKDFGCQKFGSVSLVHRSVGDRNPIIRSMDEYEALEQSDQRRYLISQLDAYGKQYLKIIEEKERRRRKLCHLQSEFISLMLPQFSIIHSIMAEGLRNEWQNKLKIIDELTRLLSENDERLNFSSDFFVNQSSSGINLSMSQRRANNGETENDDEYDNDEDETGTDYEEMSRNHNYFNGSILSLTDSSHREISPNDEVNNSAESLRIATERYQQIRRNAEELREDSSGVPVDLTTDSEFVNQLARACDPLAFKRSYGRKSIPPPTKYNNGTSDPASPKPPGLHKYKICLFRDGGYRCYYIGKDRSCNMRQHWLHRHGVDAPPEHFYARKDLTDTEVQKYKLKYEVQKSNFPKNRDPLMSTIFQQSPAKRLKLSPTHQENTPQA